MRGPHAHWQGAGTGEGGAGTEGGASWYRWGGGWYRWGGCVSCVSVCPVCQKEAHCLGRGFLSGLLVYIWGFMGLD